MPFAQPQDVFLQVGAVLRVEPGGRLVEEEQLRRVDQAHGDVEPAALAAGERGHRPVGDLAEAERVDQLGGPPPRRDDLHPVRAALADQLVAAALAVPGAVALSDVADPLPHLALPADHVEARDPRGAGGRRDERGEHAQGGRLPGAVRAEQRDQFTGGRR
nr:hypothetical protein GCM10020092_094010 [Actinoplanes digitatis]